MLDWGLWTKEERDYAREFYSSHGIACEIHYIEISGDEWERRINKRNSDIAEGRLKAYYVDDGLKEKFGRIFEPPSKNEADVVIHAG